MKIQTKIFELCKEESIELVDLARTMNVSLDYIKKIEKGEYEVDRKFVLKSLQAFPNYNTSKLFYFTY